MSEDKHKSFLKDGSITLGVISQAGPKYQKQSVYKMMKLIFCPLTNVEDFFKLILSFQVCVARHVQTTEDNKFAISLQQVKKELSDAVDFLHTDKHKTLDKLIIRFFDEYGQAFAKF